MRNPFTHFSRRGQMTLAVVFVLLWIVARQQISQMDTRFFQPSLPGIKGLMLYMIGDYNGAAKAYRAHFQELYRTERTAGDPAWDALIRGDLQTAEEISKKAIEKDPMAIDPLLNLGEIALENGKLDQALGWFDHVLQLETDQFDALLLSSVAYARSGDYGVAIDSINRAMRYDRIESRITSFLAALQMTGDLADLPKKQRPLCLLAHYYRYLRIFDESNGKIAIAYAKKAISAEDRPDDAYLTMGIVYYKQGKKQKALSVFHKGIEANPKNPELPRGAARVYSDRGDLANEYQMRRLARDARPQDPFYVDGLSYFLSEKLGDYHQALEITEQVLKVEPDSTRALHRAAYLYGFIGEYERSVEYYRRALSKEPRNPEFYMGVGYGLKGLGKNEEAITAYRAALSIDAYQPTAYLGLAHAYINEHRYREAIAAYEEAFRLDETDMTLRTDLCTLYFDVSEYEHAVDCFREVLATDPQNPSAQHLLPYALRNISPGGSIR